MPAAATWHVERLVEETKAEGFSFPLTWDDLRRLGVYADLAAAQTAIAAATFELQVPALSLALDAEVTVEVGADGASLEVTLQWWPPPTLTDTAMTHTYYVVLEPGSPTSEDVIAEGEWRVLARRAAV